MSKPPGNKNKNILRYKVGDLVRLRERNLEDTELDTEDTQDNVALVIEESRSWLTALEDVNGNIYNIWDIGTRYWDDVNFCPYKIQTLSGKILWASVNDIRLIKKKDND